jgi:hypothetical protein
VAAVRAPYRSAIDPVHGLVEGLENLQRGRTEGPVRRPVVGTEGSEGFLQAPETPPKATPTYPTSARICSSSSPSRNSAASSSSLKIAS